MTIPLPLAPSERTPSELTEAEVEVLNLTAQAWNAYLALPVLHGDDQNDFRGNLHGMQRAILARPEMRKIVPDVPSVAPGA